mgnify:CR=1 FL=1
MCRSNSPLRRSESLIWMSRSETRSAGGGHPGTPKTMTNQRAIAPTRERVDVVDDVLMAWPIPLVASRCKGVSLFCLPRRDRRARSRLLQTHRHVKPPPETLCWAIIPMLRTASEVRLPNCRTDPYIEVCHNSISINMLRKVRVGRVMWHAVCYIRQVPLRTTPWGAKPRRMSESGKGLAGIRPAEGSAGTQRGS